MRVAVVGGRVGEATVGVKVEAAREEEEMVLGVGQLTRLAQLLSALSRRGRWRGRMTLLLAACSARLRLQWMWVG